MLNERDFEEKGVCMNEQSGSVDSNKQSNNPSESQYTYKPPRFNSFMVLSMCCGVLAFFSCSVIFFSLVAGGLGILFAILSKGNDLKMQPLSKIGFITSIMSIMLSICITVGCVYFYFTNEFFHAQLNDACKQMYNQTLDEMITESYPWLSDTNPFEGK